MTEPMQLLREFVADILAVNANDHTLLRDWPDLAITFRKACELIERIDAYDRIEQSQAEAL